jgi:hypothetical protein
MQTVSEVNAADTRPIRAPEDVWALYQGAGAGASRVGAEVELAFFAPDSPTQCFMTAHQNAAVLATLAADWAHQEPTAETLELATRAVRPDALPDLLDDMADKTARLTAAAAAHGLKRSYFQELPACTAVQLLGQIVDVERYRAFFQPPRADMAGIAAYFAVCKSSQVSVSYADPAALLADVRRLYLLAPFLFLATDNGAPFVEGQPATGHTGMRYRAALGPRGGVPPYIFTAPDGPALIRAHIDHVWRNPLFVYYEPDGRLTRVPSGRWESFANLSARGLGTASNYFLAQSVLWPDVKIAALKDAGGAVTGHRYEARMFGVGPWQPAAAALIVAALAFQPDAAAQVDALLAAQGVTGATLPAAYAAARDHGGAFFAVPYGDRPMADFARAFADSMERAYAGRLEGRALAPFLEVCRSGRPDAQVSRERWPTLAAALAWQRGYDPARMGGDSNPR